MNQQLHLWIMSNINRHLRKSELNPENFESVKNNCISAFLYSSPLEPKEQLSNYKNLCEEKIALVIQYIKSGDVQPEKKVRVWHSDRMCLIQKNQAASSETTATRNDDMSPISSETSKQPPVLTTHCVGRTSHRATKRRMILSKEQKTSLPKPVKSEVTVPPVLPIIPMPTEIPGPSSPAGSQKNSFLSTDKAYLLLDYKKPIPEPDKTCNKIDVPLWSYNPLKPWSKLEYTENTIDEVFINRHKHRERDEQRSKRLDNKRLREQNTTEKQKNATEKQKSGTEKQKNKQSRKNRKSQSFYPDLIKLEFLEVTEELPILAFGYPIPFFDPSEFSLPWRAEGVSEAPKAKRGRPSVT